MSAISDGFEFGAAAVAVIGAGGTVYKFGQHRWRQTVGRRNAQSAALDRLCCTGSLAYVEAALGVPQFITGADDYTERHYRLPGAWVIVHPVGDAVRWFSITITDPTMYYDIGPMTLEAIDIRLGRDTFADARESTDETLELGPRWRTFMRHYNFGGQSAGQTYWLAFNGHGAGIFDVDTSTYTSGNYFGHGYGPHGTPPDHSKITANTLTVMSGTGDAESLRDRSIHGPHHDLVALTYAGSKRRKR